MRLLISGATGFVGAATVARALLAGHEVAVLVRDPARPGRLARFLPHIRVFKADFGDANDVEAALSQAQPEAVIHSAWTGVANSARNDPSQIYANVTQTCRFLQLAAQYRVGKFVGLGSQAEYGPLNRAIRETDTPAPTTLYGVSKLAAGMICERLAAQSGVGFAWLRLFSSYGPGDNPVWMIPALIRQLLLGQRPQTTLGTQLWDYLYIDDVADAVLATAVEAEAVGLLNLGSGKPVTVRTVIETIRQLTSPDAEIGFGEVSFRPDQVMHMEADMTRLSTLARWTPRIGIKEGLTRTVADIRERLHERD